eukprot:CAMPEP_0179008672 /NCGR_PEP_ID=MMETSP0795-20121207/15847_1 /TAXON_ID=88552 /ORGANISM="Amoebophrya sp., Strain Ameob2" /LENGTH=194 /DNA_ID=CAMNT_0020703785 /DNA_START=224 /DNA_END=808 /DNA_ORIENTATION=-
MGQSRRQAGKATGKFMALRGGGAVTAAIRLGIGIASLHSPGCLGLKTSTTQTRNEQAQTLADDAKTAPASNAGAPAATGAISTAVASRKMHLRGLKMEGKTIQATPLMSFISESNGHVRYLCSDARYFCGERIQTKCPSDQIQCERRKSWGSTNPDGCCGGCVYGNTYPTCIGHFAQNNNKADGEPDYVAPGSQ